MTKDASLSHLKLPAFITIIGPYNLLIEKLPKFLFLASFFSLILVCCSFVLGQETMCFNSTYAMKHYCVQTFARFISIKCLFLISAVFFATRWYYFGLLREKFNLKKFFTPSLSDLKIFGFLLAFVFTFVIAGISLYILFKRVPNPDWHIELLFFTVVSIGFLVPIIGLKFLSYFAYAAENVSMPSPLAIWHKTSGNMLPIVSFFAIFMIILIFLLQTSFKFASASTPTIFSAFIAEYLIGIMVFLVIACFMNYCYIQKKFFDGGDLNEANSK